MAVVFRAAQRGSECEAARDHWRHRSRTRGLVSGLGRYEKAAVQRLTEPALL